jgi:hypothetical protein
MPGQTVSPVSAALNDPGPLCRYRSLSTCGIAPQLRGRASHLKMSPAKAPDDGRHDHTLSGYRSAQDAGALAGIFGVTTDAFGFFSER